MIEVINPEIIWNIKPSLCSENIADPTVLTNCTLGYNPNVLSRAPFLFFSFLPLTRVINNRYSYGVHVLSNSSFHCPSTVKCSSEKLTRRNRQCSIRQRKRQRETRPPSGLLSEEMTSLAGIINLILFKEFGSFPTRNLPTPRTHSQ